VDNRVVTNVHYRTHVMRGSNQDMATADRLTPNRSMSVYLKELFANCKLRTHRVRWDPYTTNPVIPPQELW